MSVTKNFSHDAKSLFASLAVALRFPFQHAYAYIFAYSGGRVVPLLLFSSRFLCQPLIPISTHRILMNIFQHIHVTSTSSHVRLLLIFHFYRFLSSFSRSLTFVRSAKYLHLGMECATVVSVVNTVVTMRCDHIK